MNKNPTDFLADFNAAHTGQAHVFAARNMVRLGQDRLVQILSSANISSPEDVKSALNGESLSPQMQTHLKRCAHYFSECKLTLDEVTLHAFARHLARYIETEPDTAPLPQGKTKTPESQNGHNTVQKTKKPVPQHALEHAPV